MRKRLVLTSRGIGWDRFKVFECLLWSKLSGGWEVGGRKETRWRNVNQVKYNGRQYLAKC